MENQKFEVPPTNLVEYAEICKQASLSIMESGAQLQIGASGVIGAVCEAIKYTTLKDARQDRINAVRNLIHEAANILYDLAGECASENVFISSHWLEDEESEE